MRYLLPLFVFICILLLSPIKESFRGHGPGGGGGRKSGGRGGGYLGGAEYARYASNSGSGSSHIGGGAYTSHKRHKRHNYISGGGGGYGSSTGWGSWYWWPYSWYPTTYTVRCKNNSDCSSGYCSKKGFCI